MGGVLLVAAVLVFVGVRYANTGDRFAKPSGGPIQRVAPIPRTVHRSPRSIDQVRAVAEQFIETAVYRRHLDDAWNLTAPNLRYGISHRQWMTGNIPVVPYPEKNVAIIKWTLDYSFPHRVGIKVALLARPDSPATGLVAHMELQDAGAGASHRWLVDAWVPMGGGEELHRALSPFPQGQERVRPQLSDRWLLLPVGLICGLVLFVPLGLGVRGWVRHNRAVRAYNSSSRPS